MIDGVKITKLKRFKDERGEIRHAFKSGEDTYEGFGEAYFSTVNSGVVKGWKKHHQMHSNLIVVTGTIRFGLVDTRSGSSTYGQRMDLVQSLDNYSRLTVPPGLWIAFQGLGPDNNLLLNIANIAHDPIESETIPVDSKKATAAGLPQWVEFCRRDE